MLTHNDNKCILLLVFILCATYTEICTHTQNNMICIHTHTQANLLYYYIQRKIFFRRSFFLYSPCHYMRAWIRVLDAPGCYERAALQGSGLVRTVGPCAQRRVALR